MENNTNLARRPLQEEPKQRRYTPHPTSPTTKLIGEVVDAGSDKRKYQELQARREDIIIQQNQEDPEQLLIHQTTVRKDKNGTTSTDKKDITVQNITKLSGCNEKIFDIMLEEVNSIFQGGVLTKDSITVDLKGLVSRGVYDSTDSARRGFLTTFTALQQIHLHSIVTEASSNSPKLKGEEDGDQLFIHKDDIVNSSYRVYLNAYADWHSVLQFFTIQPNYIYKLPNYAYKLTKYIFYIARQNLDKIMKTAKPNDYKAGYFNTSLKKVQEALQLPSEDSVKHIKQLIIGVIDTAIEQIENAQNEEFNCRDISIQPMIKNGNITEYLDLDNTRNYSAREMLSKGYLEITLSGEALDYFLNLEERNRKKIAAEKAKQAAAAKKRAR